MSEGEDELSARGNPERYRPLVDGQPFRLPGGPSGIRKPQVSRLVQDQLGTGLRGMYDEFLDEPVPDHLINLVRRLS